MFSKLYSADAKRAILDAFLTLSEPDRLEVVKVLSGLVSVTEGAV